MDSKVLILSANYGDGHAQVSRALAAQLKTQGLEKVKLMNLMEQSHPLIDSISRQFYLKSYSTAPSIYGWLYHQTKNLPLESKRARWLHSFGLHKMKELLEQEKPDLLIHTFPGSAAAELKRKGGLSIPIFSVLTDFSFHQRWIHHKIDRYFVATEELKEEIASAGENPEKVVVSGIPIRSDFERERSAEPIIEKYHLDSSKPILLILAGAYGVSSDVKKLCKDLRHATDIQVILICGKNQALEEDMRRRLEDVEHFRVMGYVDHLDEFMQVATCLISKPGGVTISEALANGLPLCFFPPVAGQEEENALFLEKKEVAFILKKELNMAKQVLEKVNDEVILKALRQNSEILHESHASKTIAEHIINYLKENMRSLEQLHT